MQSARFDPRETAVLLGQGEPVNSGTLADETAVAITSYEPERVALQVTSQAKALLILTDAYYPGWEASIDGQALLIYQTDVLFRAIIVPAGQHEVVFSFESQSFANGRTLSLLGLAFGSLLAVIVIRMRKRPT